MAFNGKASYDYNTTLYEENHLDVSDLVTMISPFATPFLDALGIPIAPAESVKHEWMEDALNAVSDQVSGSHTDTATSLNVNNAAYFAVGDVLRVRTKEEAMLVTAVAATAITVTRGYGTTTAVALVDNTWLDIVGKAALEGADAAASRETKRVRKVNYTQIFSEAVKISGTEQAIIKIGVPNEFSRQLTQRTRELLKLLERSVFNSILSATVQGSDTVRRTMKGIYEFMSTNVTDNGGTLTLTETRLNAALRSAWENGADDIDLIVTGSWNKRKISSFVSPTSRYYEPEDLAFRARFAAYESDFGMQRVQLNRNVAPQDVMLLDTSLINVLPLTTDRAARSFFYQPLAPAGDYKHGEVIGEYTLEHRNEDGHAMIKNTKLT